MANNIQFISYEGFYVNDDDGEKLHKHNEYTHELYERGLSEYNSNTMGYDYIESNHYYDGVVIENDIPYAQWAIDGETRYIKL